MGGDEMYLHVSKCNKLTGQQRERRQSQMTQH